jgi:hypothetical protein
VAKDDSDSVVEVESDVIVEDEYEVARLEDGLALVLVKDL